MMHTPILETKRLLLRPFELKDIEEVFYGWESDPEVAKYMFWKSHNDLNKSKEWVQKEIDRANDPMWYRFAIVKKQPEELIGTGLIYFEDEVDGWEIAYNLSRKYWNEGFTTEAMKEILRFAKHDLEIKEVIARYATENQQSGSVLAKLGFNYEKEITLECNKGETFYKGKQCRRRWI